MCKEMDEVYNWGREHEKENTEKERKRADKAEERADQAQRMFNRVARLTTILLENGRIEDCLRAVNDEKYQLQLMIELNIA